MSYARSGSPSVLTLTWILSHTPLVSTPELGRLQSSPVGSKLVSYTSFTAEGVGADSGCLPVRQAGLHWPRVSPQLPRFDCPDTGSLPVFPWVYTGQDTPLNLQICLLRPGVCVHGSASVLILSWNGPRSPWRANSEHSRLIRQVVCSALRRLPSPPGVSAWIRGLYTDLDQLPRTLVVSNLTWGVMPLVVSTLTWIVLPVI